MQATTQATSGGSVSSAPPPDAGAAGGATGRSRVTWLIAGVGLLLLAVLPFLFATGTYSRYVLVTFFVNAMLAVSFQLLFGYAKLISFGHAALMAFGAYGVAIGTVNLGVPAVVSWLGALAVTAVFAAAVGWIVLRLSELFLAVVTLAFGLALVVLLRQIGYVGGEEGLFVDPLAFGDADQSLVDYYFAAVVFCVLLFLAVRLSRFRFGRELLTVGNDPVVAGSTGMDVTRTRVKVFVVASLMAAVAGIVYAHTFGLASPSAFDLNRSILILAMVVVGGLGSMPGAVLGAALLTAVPEVFASLAEYNTLIYGALLVGILLVSPGGLVGLLGAPSRVARRAWRARRPAHGTMQGA